MSGTDRLGSPVARATGLRRFRNAFASMTAPLPAADPEDAVIMSRLAFVATFAALLVLVAACTTTGPAPSGSVQPSATASVASVAPSPSPSAPPSVAASLASFAPSASSGPSATVSGSGAAVPSTTTVDWGEIWDALPADYPNYPGSQPTVTGGDPASAVLDIPTDGKTASAWYATALGAAGFTIVGVNGPREDGSFNIVATRGGGDCETEISLAPLGATTTATIYLAAACPFG